MVRFFRRYLLKIKEYDQISNFLEIGRRYFAMNSFDGILTILGFLLGSYFAGVAEPKVIITTGLGASMAMAVSGLWGTYLTENAERKKALQELELATLHKIKNTKINEAEAFATIAVSLIDGFSPFMASLIVLIPFFITAIPIHMMFYSSWAIAFTLLMLLGIFLGRISRENIFMSILKMVFAGVFCVVLSLMLTKI